VRPNESDQSIDRRHGRAAPWQRVSSGVYILAP
jgi:hypothetical protein